LGKRARYVELPRLHHVYPLFDDRVIGEILGFIEARATKQV
jgi:hypothetical protein